mgnify:CR=1 FL=1
MAMLAAGGAAALGAGTASAAAAPGWATVAPILTAKCSTCHVQGGPAPFPLRGYAQAKERAALIAAAVGSGAMPPWMPGPDSPRFIGQDQRTLTKAERAAVLDWVRGGAKR